MSRLQKKAWQADTEPLNSTPWNREETMFTFGEQRTVSRIQVAITTGNSTLTYVSFSWRRWLKKISLSSSSSRSSSFPLVFRNHYIGKYSNFFFFVFVVSSNISSTTAPLRLALTDNLKLFGPVFIIKVFKNQLIIITNSCFEESIGLVLHQHLNSRTILNG